MKKLIATKNMPKDVWLRERRKGICGSDASIVLGINKYKSGLELWKEKTNQIPVQEKENKYAYWGHVMESVIKKEFMKRTGKKVRAVNYILQSSKYEWMLADVDGVVKEEDGSYSLFEAKTASEYKREVWERGIPEEYKAQVQHYLFVLNYQKAYVCAIVGGNTFFCYEVQRDEEYIKMLVEKEQAFWNCVLANTHPEIDGSKAMTEYLSQEYTGGGDVNVELPDGTEELAKEYLELDNDIKKLTEKKDAVANSLKAIMQNVESGYAGDHVISWKTVNDRKAYIALFW